MADQEPNAANAAQREFWNSPATRAWADQHERMDRVLADFTKQILEFAAPRPGEHVLDIGCGGGTTTLELAARVGPSGHVLGADISENSIARVRQRIADAGLKQAEAVVADVSAHAFSPESVDLVFSRFGVMFFADPTAAFANVWRAVKRGGRLAVAVFRTPKENPWPHGPVDAVRHLLPPIPVPGPEDPGPFSWAEPARVRRILEGAGFREVSLTPLDPIIRLAPPGGDAEATDFMMVFGPLTRILPSLSTEQRDVVRAELAAFFRHYDGPQGIVLPAANWVVQARA
jgi:SAM-dependent methyltransferase